MGRTETDRTITSEPWSSTLGPKKHNEWNRSSEWMEKFVLKTIWQSRRC